jgi:hypothetical protein
MWPQVAKIICEHTIKSLYQPIGIQQADNYGYSHLSIIFQQETEHQNHQAPLFLYFISI